MGDPACGGECYRNISDALTPVLQVLVNTGGVSFPALSKASGQKVTGQFRNSSGAVVQPLASETEGRGGASAKVVAAVVISLLICSCGFLCFCYREQIRRAFAQWDAERDFDRMEHIPDSFMQEQELAEVGEAGRSHSSGRPPKLSSGKPVVNQYPDGERRELPVGTYIPPAVGSSSTDDAVSAPHSKTARRRTRRRRRKRAWPPGLSF